MPRWTSPWPQRNQALYSYEKTVRSAFKEVNDSLDAISRYGEQLTELQEQETVAQEPYVLPQNRYRNGYSSYLDVLDASERCSPPSLAWCR
ncbi:NodT family RND efflux system outer membrane lipoprotein [Klebsiella pneumoniae]|uniref:NodT family RND efflux system outer membrane lipoprotein n=1 Tax=Klebsiella pneumoniae TaxID=573 RepID=A0A2X1S9B0_KLEPN|nr:NodT family RND efflux system outer membrane lipoprotein [Klebsiella pneumoniae]